MVFEQVCADLESAGYEVRATVIPAVAVNAPHRRDRVWFVAHRTDIGSGGVARQKRRDGERKLVAQEQERDTIRGQSQGCLGVSRAHSAGERLRGDGSGEELQPAPSRARDGMGEENDANTSIKRLERSKHQKYPSSQFDRKTEWSKNWLKVASRFCKLDDGVSDRMVRPKGWRNAALKALGNAIVPAVAEQIMLAIKQTCGTIEA